MDLQGLSIDDLIIHQVPKKPAPGSPAIGPILSTVSDPQTPKVREYFIERLQKVMMDRGFGIERKAGLDTAGSDAVVDILKDKTKLINASQILAKRLFDVQDRRSPEGILVVAICSLNGKPALGLLKLEHERGVQAEQKSTAEGLTFEIVLHEDLMLTKRTAVFKAAIFRLDKNKALEGEASDNQVEERVASFFLEDMLGCGFVMDPALMTEEYFDATEEFITGLGDPERKARYEMALLTQMHTPAVKTVDPVKFAEETFETEDQQPFFDHLKAQGVGEQRFVKDTAEIKGRIQRMAYDFESGIKLFGKPDAIRDHVEVSAGALDGPSTVTVTDEISSVHARG